MGSAQSKAAPSAEAASTTASFNEKHVSPTPSMPTVSKSGKPASAEIVAGTVKSWETDFSKDLTAALSQTILRKTDIPTALFNAQLDVSDRHIYNTRLVDDSTVVSNQRASGRCWLFATTNVCRINLQRALKLSADFELSQSYLFFYDKLEKSNYYLENTIELADKPLDDRVVSYLAQAPINDGGQQDMACAIIEKYGFVPKAIFPESFHSSNSAKLNNLLTTYLRQSALSLRKLIAAGATVEQVRTKKEEFMSHVWKVLAITLGTPPKPDEKFTWEYYDKDNKFGSITATPLEFSKKYAGPYPFTESFSLINDPRNDYGKLYTVDRLGNVWGGRKVLYVNTEVNRLKAAVIKSIKANQAVFFGCDVGAFSTRAGQMDLDTYDYKTALDLDFTLTKAERLQVNDSAMTHAMVITAVHLDKDGKPVRWRVENSWSDAAGEKGFMVMSDRWFDEYVYQVVIHKSISDKDLVAILDTKAVVLPAYDPMGALA